jgi:hypothetical protein
VFGADDGDFVEFVAWMEKMDQSTMEGIDGEYGMRGSRLLVSGRRLPPHPNEGKRGWNTDY